MNLNFSQSTGIITQDNGVVVTTLAFAGNNYRADMNPTGIKGRNNPLIQDVHCIGPLPQGLYRVGTWGTYHPVGQNAAPLTQIGGNTYGRSGFFIHGPGANDPMNSSEGCICVPHDDRMKIIALNPTTVTVTA